MKYLSFIILLFIPFISLGGSINDIIPNASHQKGVTIVSNDSLAIERHQGPLSKSYQGIDDYFIINDKKANTTKRVNAPYNKPCDQKCSEVEFITKTDQISLSPSGLYLYITVQSYEQKTQYMIDISKNFKSVYSIPVSMGVKTIRSNNNKQWTTIAYEKGGSTKVLLSEYDNTTKYWTLNLPTITIGELHSISAQFMRGKVRIRGIFTTGIGNDIQDWQVIYWYDRRTGKLIKQNTTAKYVGSKKPKS